MIKRNLFTILFLKWMGKTICLFLLFFSTLSNGQGYIRNCDNIYNTVYSAETFSKKSEQDLLMTCNNIFAEAIENSNSKEALQSITTAIRIYSELGDNYNVLKRIEKALSIAQDEKDYYRLSLLYTYMGRAFVNLGLYSKARNAFDIGLKLSSNVLQKDNRHILKLQHYGGIAMIFEHSNPTIGDKNPAPFKDSMMYYVQKAYLEARMISPKHAGKPRWLGIKARIVGSVSLATHKYEKAAQYLKEAEKLLSNLKDKRFMIALYRFKGLLAYNSVAYNHNQNALDLYNESYRIAQIYDIPTESYFITDALASLYSEMRMTVPARLRADDSKKLRNEIDQSEREAIPIAEKIEVSLDNKFHSELITYAIIGVIIIAIAAAYYYIRIRQGDKNSAIHEEITEVNFIDVKSHTEQINQLLQMAKENDGSFYIVFKQVFPEFQKKLLNLNSDLSASDLELCAYLKLNLQTKEIAKYKNNTISSVDNRKTRLRKKLSLSSETNLYIWIDSI